MGTKYNRDRPTSVNDWSGFNADFVTRSAARARMSNRSAHLLLSAGLFVVAMFLIVSAPILHQGSAKRQIAADAVVTDKTVVDLPNGDQAHLLTLDITVPPAGSKQAPVAVDAETWATCKPGTSVKVIYTASSVYESGIRVHELQLPQSAAALTDEAPDGDTVTSQDTLPAPPQ